jgi:2,4-dienoyl-CoA reductase-like NADH-dependent reductase (Old Yellow Enzyme family)
MIACENPYLPRENTKILTDDDIYGIIDDYVRAAALMKQAGFDAVDIRACHGYLLNEMLSAYTRENSVFGGSFDNRTRMLLMIVDRVNAEVGIPMACRLSACDLVPYPYGFGMKTDGSMDPDFAEPLKLGRILADKGVKLLNLSLGRNHAHHLQSPSDSPALRPKHHQLVSIDFFHSLAREFKRALPDVVIMTGTFAWARQYGANLAIGGIENGHFDLAGFARTALANPNFANEILKDGMLSERRCITCGNCSRLIGHSASEGAPTGCVTYDKAFYVPYFQKFVRPSTESPSISPEKVYPLKLFDLYPQRNT